MNYFETLFFPETNIFNEKIYPLLLFFTPLHFLQVVEHGLGSVTNSEVDLFLKTGLCQAHVPAPLGDNRGQFLQLTRDISKRKEQLVDRLRGLILDSSPALTGSKPYEIKQGIVFSLLQEYGIEHATTVPDLQIWQARLVLAIAEIHDCNEESLLEQLLFFNEDEIAAFRSLQDATHPNEEDLFTKLDIIKARLEKFRLGGITKRFDAWLRLLQNQSIPPVKVWLASSRDSADQIFNRCRSTSKPQAVPLLQLALPAQIAASDKYVIKQIEKFQQATMQIHQGLVADFERIVRTVPYVPDVLESLLPYDIDWADRWESALHDYFPASNYGRNEITFYLLPDQSLSQLLSLQESSDISHKKAAHGLLAILGTPKAL